MGERRNHRTRTDLVVRVRSEFSDMPGLRLTLEQASKLWAQRSDVCERVLQQLVHEGTLRRGNDNAYGRTDLGA